MGRFGRSLAGSVMPAVALLVLLDTPSWSDSTEAAQNEIRSALEKWQIAFNDRDQRRVCDLFAADVIANYQNQPERDYTSLCELLRTSLQDPERRFRYSLDINEILVYGAAAVVRLVWTLEIEKDGAPKEIVEESAVDIFRRQADGSWRLSRYLAYPASP
jgi:ketosteroid isomerase-like protein